MRDLIAHLGPNPLWLEVARGTVEAHVNCGTPPGAETRRKSVATPHKIRERGRWSLVAGTLMTAVLLLAIAGSSAFGASVSSASLSGAAGTVNVGGTLYAETGGALSLTVNTGSNTRCVDVTGAHTARQTSTSAQTSWTFSLA